MITEYRVKVTGYAPTTAEAAVSVEYPTRAQRIRRAVGGFLLFFGLTIVSVFIPAAHFLLVPIFLITSFVVLFVRLGQRSRVLKAHGKCPDCGAEQDIDMPSSWHLPLDVSCRSCQRRLTLSQIS